MPDTPDLSSTADARRRLLYSALYLPVEAPVDAPALSAAERDAITQAAYRAAWGYTATPAPTFPKRD